MVQCYCQGDHCYCKSVVPKLFCKAPQKNYSHLIQMCNVIAFLSASGELVRKGAEIC